MLVLIYALFLFLIFSHLKFGMIRISFEMFFFLSCCETFAILITKRIYHNNNNNNNNNNRAARAKIDRERERERKLRFLYILRI